jgi:hypothetical protein
MSDENEMSVGDIKRLFAQTIFWNWAESVDEGLKDSNRREDCEWPLELNPARQEEGEDPHADQWLTFEMGECSITVARVFIKPPEADAESTATPDDAEFIAKLPLIIPTLFRRIAELEGLERTVRKWGDTMTDDEVGSLAVQLEMSEYLRKHPVAAEPSHAR